MTDATPLQTTRRAAVGLRKTKVWMAAVAVLLIGSVATLWTLQYLAHKRVPLSTVTIAVPGQINSATVIVAMAQNLFTEAGVAVVNQPHALGKDALKALLEDKADLALMTDSPFMGGLLAGNDIAVLAAVSQSRHSMGIVVHKDHGIHSMQDLAGKSVSVTQGTNLPYFLELMLQTNGIDSRTVTQKQVPLDANFGTFREGKVDAAVAYQPALAQMEQTMGDRIQVFYGDDVYAFRFLLIGKRSYIDSHSPEIRRVLSALVAASASIAKNPTQARQAVGQFLHMDDATMARVFDPRDYGIALDQSILLALDDQTRWAMARGLIKQGPMPNYLNAMKYQDLEAVMPTAVTMVH